MQQTTETDDLRTIDYLRLLWERLVDRPLKQGRRVQGRYVVEQCLGMGSYGISYRCRDEQTGQWVVLKQVRPSRRRGRKGRPIYDYETALLAALDHPRIPQLLAKFEEKGQLYFVMEYIAGRNFEDVIFEEQLTFTEREALEVVLELLDIVEHLHEQGIVHRDVRIPNVMVKDGRLHLIDFGLARRLGDPATSVAEELADYEEAKQIKRAVEFPSDFYSMGHFLLFLLYTTFEARGEAAGSWQEELPISAPTRAILERMLQIEAPYATAQELRRDVEAALRKL